MPYQFYNKLFKSRQFMNSSLSAWTPSIQCHRRWFYSGDDKAKYLITIGKIGHISTNKIDTIQWDVKLILWETWKSGPIIHYFLFDLKNFQLNSKFIGNILYKECNIKENSRTQSLWIFKILFIKNVLTTVK